MAEHLNILIIDGLVQQVVEAESAGYHEHEALVELARDVKQDFVVVLKLQAVILNIVNHSRLLLVEELPDLENIFEVLACHLVEVALLVIQLLLVLFLQHLEVECQEPHYFRGVLGLKTVDIVE